MLSLYMSSCANTLSSMVVAFRQAGGGSAHLGEEEGDDDEPDDVVAEGGETLREGERLGGDHRRGRQERPRARWQRLQHQACAGS